MGLITMNCAHGHYAGKCENKHCTCECHAVRKRLEYLRGEIEAERISTAEIVELQGLAEHIDRGDVLLLQWAGVPEFDDEDDDEDGPGIERRIIWTDPDGGQERLGRIMNWHPNDEEHDAIFDDGGEAGVMEHEIEYL